MSEMNNASSEADRLLESARDALSDDIVGRLGTIAGDGLDLLDKATQSNLDKALPAISRLVETGDLDRVVNAARVLGSAGDALTDDIVSRMAETAGELMCIADRLARSEGLMRLLDLLERDHVMDTLVSLGEAAATAKASHEPASDGGVMGMVSTMKDPDVQDALKFFATLFKEFKS